MGAEITCPACGKVSFLRREPIFEGLRKVGERLSCTDCGHVFAPDQAIPVKERQRPAIFSDDDRPSEVRLFDASEERRNCRYCKSYVVNPFTQWCSTHRREVAATDLCDRFERQPEPESAAE